MSYRTYTVWEDDDVVAESDDGLTRVVLRPDEDATLDGDSYPILVRLGRGHYSGAESCDSESWYYPPSEATGADALAFAYAVGYFRDRGGRQWENMLSRWVRLYLGGTGFRQIDTDGDTFFCCDSAALRKIWGTPDDTAYDGELGDGDEREIKAFLDGETYGYMVQERESDEYDDWTDTDESLWGLIGRDWAEAEARTALKQYLNSKKG